MSDNAEYLELLEQNGVDVGATLDRFVGNEELFITYFRKFFKETKLQELKQAIIAENYDEIISIAHAHKGVTGNLGLTVLHCKFGDMVTDVRKERYDRLAELLDVIEMEFKAMKIIAQ